MQTLQRLLLIICTTIAYTTLGTPSSVNQAKKVQGQLSAERTPEANRQQLQNAPQRGASLTVSKTTSPQKPKAARKKIRRKKPAAKKAQASSPVKRVQRIRGTGVKQEQTSVHEKLLLLQKTIDKLAHEADTSTSIGIKVLLLANQHTVYQKNAQKLFTPASNTKIITAAAAYHILGPDYRFKTTMFTDKKINKRKINHLYIRGSGDPTLDDKDLTKMVLRLKALGISEISGNVIVDHSIFNNQSVAPGVRTGDAAIFDKSPISGLMCNHSCVYVTVKPTNAIGRKPHVSISPLNSDITLDNRAETKAHQGTTLHVLRGQNNGIIIKGVIAKRSKPKSYRIAIEHPARFAGHVLREVLKKNGIIVKGMVTSGTVPKSATHLTEHSSTELDGIIRFMMKTSDNLYADALYKAMGAHQYGAPGSWENGKKAVDNFLEDTVGLPTSELKLFDGSGLSHNNKIAPDHLCQFLTWEYTQSPHKENFIASLPIGGVDGTLRKRMKHPTVRSVVKAKTGSLSGVTSLSGYITPKSGLPLIFVIMVNRSNKSAVEFKRKLEDQLCTLLATHAFSAR